MDFGRFQQVLKYGWEDAISICNNNNWEKSKRVFVYFDIIRSFLLYRMKSIQYVNEHFAELNSKEKKKRGTEILLKNKERDNWYKWYFQNQRFLAKYTIPKYGCSVSLQEKRNKAYQKQYGLGKDCWVHEGVLIYKEHFSKENLCVGKKVVFTRELDIDYTGGLKICDYAAISEGTKIITHNHESGINYSSKMGGGGVMYTPLVIGERAWIGSRVTILPNVREIGRGSIISAGSVCTKKVPPYAIVMGNPGRIIGFRLSPEEIVEYELATYPEEQRLSMDLLTNNYEKFFLKRLKEIKDFIK